MNLIRTMILGFVVASMGAAANAAPLTSGNLAAGYGRRMGDENRAVAFPSRDVNGNRIIVNGLISSASGLGGGLSGGGLSGGAGDATDNGSPWAINSAAVANQINVQASGSGNVIVVTAVQNNYADVASIVGF